MWTLSRLNNSIFIHFLIYIFLSFFLFYIFFLLYCWFEQKLLSLIVTIIHLLVADFKLKRTICNDNTLFYNIGNSSFTDYWLEQSNRNKNHWSIPDIDQLNVVAFDSTHYVKYLIKNYHFQRQRYIRHDSHSDIPLN